MFLLLALLIDEKESFDSAICLFWVCINVYNVTERTLCSPNCLLSQLIIKILPIPSFKTLLLSLQNLKNICFKSYDFEVITMKCFTTMKCNVLKFRCSVSLLLSGSEFLQSGKTWKSQGISKFLKSQGISKLLKSWKKYSKIKIFQNIQNYPEKQGICIWIGNLSALSNILFE